MSMSQSSVGVLECWWLLELFNPQKVPKLTGRAMRPEDRQVVEWRPGEALPWQVLQPPRPMGTTQRVWRHTVYLGVYDLEATYQRLHEVFAEDRDVYDERRAGLSACAGVLVDDAGMLLPDSAVLSSALWAVSKLAAGRPPQGTGWASGFAEASAKLVEEVDALEGARREASGQELPPPQDEESLQRLLASAHAAAGTAGDNELSSQRIVIRSVAVSDRLGVDSTNDMDFLNSFFLDDLATVHDDVVTNGLTGALASYLTADTAAHADARVDVMTNHHVVDDAVSIKRLPKGRWPTEPAHGLALRQQFAVNQALTDLSSTGGLMGVNGPPGTGKTTMLRDVLAGNVVERARRLAALSHPADAFTQITHRWTAADGHPRRVRQLRDELTGFEMVVASTNNTAVENVSSEIPARTAIAENWQVEADYFADIATATLRAAAKTDKSSSAETDDSLVAWGLVAARLGNKSNRAAFRSEFWFDKTSPRTKQRIPGTAPRMHSRLLQWHNGEVPIRSWPEARDAFQQAERRVDELIEARRAAEERLARFGDALRADAEVAKRAVEIGTELGVAAEAVRSQAREVERSTSAVVRAIEDRDRHVETRPSALETLFSLGRAARDWRNALGPLDVAVQEAQQRQTASQERANQLEDARAKLAAEFANNEELRSQLSSELAALRRRLAADRDRYGCAYPGEEWTGPQRELRAPWLDAEIDEARSDLFLAALRLHEDFLSAVAGDMREGLRAAIDVVAGAHPSCLEPEKVRAAWQLFFLVVPMVSTTFASFGRMFKGLGSGSLGWVLIDEAGQACPQHAVGAIWRARRVIAVGDPLQLQPVVTIPAKAQSAIASAYSVSDTWIPPHASVQTLADRVSRYGTRLCHGEKTVWVSSPLTVHRRCDEPMFSLFNDIAYNGIMVSGLTRRPDHFDSLNGARIPASRWLDEAARTAGTHLQRNQIARLRRGIEALRDDGIAADKIIAISPFREVADHLARLEQDYQGLKAGTIHTAQGREADVVFLVLGGDPAAPGAKEWAAATVNLVNVAASRAKRRLYVIGDQSAWVGYNYFNQLGAALDQHHQDRQGRVT